LIAVGSSEEPTAVLVAPPDTTPDSHTTTALPVDAVTETASASPRKIPPSRSLSESESLAARL
jgi:hypothetical protein